MSCVYFHTAVFPIVFKLSLHFFTFTLTTHSTLR